MPDNFAYDVSIIIPTFNQVAMTVQCVASIAQSLTGADDAFSYEIIVVDNGSVDETRSWIESHTHGQLRGSAQGKAPASIRLVFNPVGRALAKSWNMGIEAARGRHLLITNNDVIFAPGSIEAMIAAADSEAQIGMVLPLGTEDASVVAPVIEQPMSPQYIAANMTAVAAVSHGEGTEMVAESYIRAGLYCFLLTRAARAVLGKFDEDYKLTGEDWDACVRLRRHLKIARALGAFVYHYEHSTCAGLAGEYYERLARNRFLLTEKREGIREDFSIILPVRDRVDALREAIESVTKQTYAHWRLYVIDDGSTPENWKAVRNLIATRYRDTPFEGRIAAFHLPEGLGPGAARNTGLRLCTGKYVAFLDSDDLWYPHHLDAHYRAHESGAWTLVYSRPDFAWRYRVGESFVHVPAPHPTINHGPWDHVRLTRGNYLQTSAVTIFGDTARQYRFPEDRTIEEDWAYFLEVTDAGGVGRAVLALEGPNAATVRYHMAIDPHEADHLLRQAPGVDAQSVAGHTPQVDPRSDWTVVKPLPEINPDILMTVAIPYLAVVIPTRDRPADTVKRALTSALRSIGVVAVVVDDGGLDPGAITPATITPDGAVVVDNQIAVLRMNEPSGPSAARNRAVAFLPESIEWVQFLDDDDTLTADWERLLAPYLSDPAVDIVVTLAWVSGVDGSGLAESSEVYTSQVCVRRSTFLRLGGFLEECRWGEEREMIERFEKAHGARVVYAPVATVYRSAQPGGSGDPAKGPQMARAAAGIEMAGSTLETAASPSLLLVPDGNSRF